jgi:hypothetical protein
MRRIGKRRSYRKATIRPLIARNVISRNQWVGKPLSCYRHCESDDMSSDRGRIGDRRASPGISECRRYNMAKACRRRAISGSEGRSDSF